MPKIRDGAALRQIRSLWDVGALNGLGDDELLGCFLDREGDAAEPAFAALVGRHGPMVLRACRTITRDEEDARDAYQATFLVLARKAKSLRVGDSLGPWLREVARRVASRARAAASLRRLRERDAAVSEAEAPGSQGTEELGALIREEIDRLPEVYRVALTLCAVEGLTCEQAARRLGWPPGSVRSRLERGKRRLRLRLSRRDLAPSVGLLGADLAKVPASLARRTTRIAILMVSGLDEPGLIPASVSSLTKGAYRAMLSVRLKVLTATALALAALGAVRATAQSRPNRPATPPARAVELPGLQVAGRTAIDPDAIAQVRTTFDARVMTVMASVGCAVKKGDPLVELDSTAMALSKADFLLKHARWEYDKRVIEIRRLLAAKGRIAPEQWAETQLAEQTSRVNSLAAVDKLITYGVAPDVVAGLIAGRSDDLSKLILRAPADGIVTSLAAVPGNQYEAADFLIEVANLDRLHVWAEVREADRDKVRVGQAADVRMPFGDRTIRGTVDQVAGEVAEETRAIKVRVTIPNLGHALKSQMLVRVTIDPAPAGTLGKP